jgi:hypothetical protein
MKYEPWRLKQNIPRAKTHRNLSEHVEYGLLLGQVAADAIELSGRTGRSQLLACNLRI